MALSFSVSIPDLEDIILEELQRAQLELDRIVYQSMVRAATRVPRIIDARVRRYTPVRTGRLQRSIRTVVDVDGNTLQTLQIRIYIESVFYGRPVNAATRFLDAALQSLIRDGTLSRLFSDAIVQQIGTELRIFAS